MELDEALVLGERSAEIGAAEIVQVPPLAIEAAVVAKGVDGMAEDNVLDRPHLGKASARHRTARLHLRQGLRSPHGGYGSTAAKQGNSAKKTTAVLIGASPGAGGRREPGTGRPAPNIARAGEVKRCVTIAGRWIKIGSP